jgi:hypothetical protein
VRHALTLRDFRLLDAVGGTPTGRAPLARLAEQPAEPENALLDCLVALGRCGLVRSAASHPGAAELTDAGRTRLAEAQQNVPALLRERLAQRLAAAVLTP